MYVPIEFPGLGLRFNFDPIVFSIGPFNLGSLTLGPLTIHWYGVIIAVGFLLAVLYAGKACKRYGIKDDDFLDLLIVATPIAIICARLYYVVFNFGYFRDDLWRIVRLWEGGLAFYGAVIGAALTVIIGCRIKKMNTWAMLDILALGFLIGNSIGRWGNFVNREAFGSVTNLPWRMTINGVAAHPTFLYESLLTGIGFLVLHFLSKNRKFNGQIFLLFVAWYGLGRGLIEGLRMDSLYLFNTPLRVSQLLGFISCVAALGVLLYQIVFVHHDEDSLRAYRVTAAGSDSDNDDGEALADTDTAGDDDEYNEDTDVSGGDSETAE